MKIKKLLNQKIKNTKKIKKRKFLHNENSIFKKIKKKYVNIKRNILQNQKIKKKEIKHIKKEQRMIQYIN